MVLQQLAQRSQVIYLGELHSRPEDHQAQLEIIRALHQQQPKLTIAMEMFQRPYQSVLDRYLKGEITEAQLVELSQYRRRWGYPWELYAPILRFAKDQGLPVLALNTPTEVTRKVGRQGLASLSVVDRRFIPPLSEIRTDDPPYRQRIRQVFDEIHQGKGNSDRFERFFQAQVLWDETMAERIAQSLKANPDRLVVVMTGQGHVLFGDGIPSRVARRMGSRPFSQSIILLNPTPDLPKGERPIADYFWRTFGDF